MLGSSRLEAFCKKVTLKNLTKFTGKRRSPVFKEVAGSLRLISKETPAHVCFCEFCKVFWGSCFAGHMRTATPECSLLSIIYMFSDFSEKKTLNHKLTGNTWASLS